MKIGILTFWNVPNYGSFMQAYALQRYLSSVFAEDDVELISYLNKKHFRKYYSVFDTSFRLWAINPHFYLSLLKNVKNRTQKKKLQSFLGYYNRLKHTEPFSKRTLKRYKFDTVVLGSDIVWDFSVPFFGNDPFLFGDELYADNIVSYAASFGMASKSSSVPVFARRGIERLSAISVRDYGSLSLVTKSFKRQCALVADPTLLWDFVNDTNIKRPKLGFEYVLVYGSFFSDEMIDKIQRYKDKNGLKIVCINSLDDAFGWCDIQIDQDSLDPFEWAGYFSDAKLVMTCTFHGLLFGIIFNRPLLFNKTDFISAKADFILDALDLNGFLRRSADPFAISESEWQEKYTHVNRAISRLRDQAFDFLNRAMVSNDGKKE